MQTTIPLSVSKMNKRRNFRRRFLPAGKIFCGALLFSVAYSRLACAVSYTGRATAGGYLANEKLKSERDGLQSNDFATASSKLFTRFTDFTSERLELTFDVRDKHDFFDKLDAERLALKGRNTIQARQLSLKRGNPENSWLFTLGRFPIIDAGTVALDGIDMGFRWDENWRTSFFGGLDPKLADQTYYQLNRGAYAFGTYTVFHPKATSWNSSAWGSSALVAKQVNGHLDRLYFYNFFLYEWASPSRLMGMLYLDFKPRTYVQTGLVSYTQKLSNVWQSTIQGTAIDVIEYTRRRGVLETIAPSPYKELSMSMRQRLSSTAFLDYTTSYGLRALDSKNAQEFSVGPTLTQFPDKDFSLNFKTGYRKNFTSKDYFAKLGLGYFPEKWDFSLDQYFAIQKDNGQYYHLLISDFSIAHFFSREFYSTFSIQRATSEAGKVNSYFLFLGYRFGSSNEPPLKSSASPRNKL